MDKSTPNSGLHETLSLLPEKLMARFFVRLADDKASARGWDILVNDYGPTRAADAWQWACQELDSESMDNHKDNHNGQCQ